MKLTQIRNATLLLNYAGVKFLIDPMLADKEARKVSGHRTLAPA